MCLLMEVSGSRVHGDGHIFEFRDDYVDNLMTRIAVLLQAAVGDESGCVVGDFVKAFPNIGFDDEIDLAGLVFERHERDAPGSARPLTHENYPGHASKLAIFHSE